MATHIRPPDVTGLPFYGRKVSAVTFARLRGSGTSTIKLRLGYASWTGQGRFRCDSGAAADEPAEGELNDMLNAQAKYDDFKALPLIVFPD